MEGKGEEPRSFMGNIYIYIYMKVQAEGHLFFLRLMAVIEP